MRARARDQGQATAEYVGILAFLVVALAALGVAAPDVAGSIGSAIRSAFCALAEDPCEGGRAGPRPSPPERSAGALGMPGDTDGDGDSDAHEAALGTDPADRDSDGDGLADPDETARRTNPLDRDSDDDGIDDGDEVALALNPAAGGDFDGDGTSDVDELRAGTNPRAAAEHGWSRDPITRDLADPASSDPERVRDLFNGLTDEERRHLVETYPDVIGSLDGAPAQMRYQANDILMEREVARLTMRRDELRAAYEGLKRVPDPRVWGSLNYLADQIAEVQARIDLFSSWATSDRQFLLFDPSGDGRVAEVIGDVDSADNVAVLVPGGGNDIMGFEGFRDRAQRVQDTVGDVAPSSSTASIAWLGYDTPADPRENLLDGISITRTERAERGGRALVRFVDGLNAQRSDAHVTVVSHSYGTPVAGHALVDGLRTHDVIFLGSPGVGVDRASDLGSGFNIWAAQTEDDWIDHVPNVSFLGFGHKKDPTDRDFGATVFATEPARGHSGYFDRYSESLYNIARVVAGRYDDVSRCEEVGCPGYP